mgnify:CR=1 FL=1
MSETIDGLKQRLVGAFVILSLAVIFLPMIFDNPHEVKKVTIKEVPDKPQFQKILIEKAQRPVFKVVDIDPTDRKIKEIEPIIDQTPLSGEISETKLKQSINTNKLKKESGNKEQRVAITPKVSHLPVFKNIWMVQLGTFTIAKNAYELRDKLRKDGFDGHAKDIYIKGKKAVRVFSGPFVNKKDAEKIKKKLDKKYRVKSLVIYFDA